MDEETFEEQTSFRLTRMTVYIFVSTVLVLLVLFVTSAIVFTPLKEYIPGYADEVKMKKALTTMKFRMDSMENLINARDLYLQNIRNVIEGKVDSSTGSLSGKRVKYDTAMAAKISSDDSVLRVEIEQEEKFSVLSTDKKTSYRTVSISDYYFFTPLKGIVTNDYSQNGNHFGIDIVAPENETIKATLDGYVIFADWTLETGYVIAIQHENNMLSFYKHNSVLLKKIGNFVKAGDAIAIIGSSGELTTGPHLHFELWFNGAALNPKDYINF